MTTEVIEGVVTEVRDEPRGLAIVPEQRAHLMSGLGAVALLTDDEFERNLELLTKGKQRAQAIQKAILTEGVDYGKVPGVDRPFLHKPGAEVMEKAYGLATSYEIERKVGNGEDVPALEYIVHAKVHLGDTDGPIVAEGVGSCNTHESKYRFRRGERVCPDCNQPSIIKGKDDGRLAGKWWCASFKGGCGHAFEKDDPRLVDQQVGQVENTNPYDLANTILKMARKRAGVDGILTATGTSGLFTQDADSPAVEPPAGTPPADQPPAASSSSGSSSTSRPSGSALPAIPRNLEERTSIGTATVTGTASVSRSGPTSGELRQTPDGDALGFRLDLGGNAKLPRVLARGPVATALAERLEGNPEKLVDAVLTVTGEVFAVPWTKKEDGVDKPMPPYREMVVSSVDWGGVRIPGNGTAPAAEQPTGTAPAAGGMTHAQLTKVLDAGRIATAYATTMAKDRFGIDSLEGLSDRQRLELAAELDLIGPDEEG